MFYACFSDIYPQLALCGSLDQQRVKSLCSDWIARFLLEFAALLGAGCEFAAVTVPCSVPPPLESDPADVRQILNLVDLNLPPRRFENCRSERRPPFA